MIVFIITFAGALGFLLPVTGCVLCFLSRRREWVNDYLQKQERLRLTADRDHNHTMVQAFAAQPEALDPENLESGAAQVQVEVAQPTQQQHTAPTEKAKAKPTPMTEAKAKPNSKAAAAQEHQRIPTALSWLFTIRNLEWQMLSDEQKDAMKAVVLRRLTQEMSLPESSGRMVITKNSAAGSEDTVKVSGRLALPPRALGEKLVDSMREAQAKKAKLTVVIRSAIQDDISAIERIHEAKADKAQVVAVDVVAVSILVKAEAVADTPTNGAAAFSDQPANGSAASSSGGGNPPLPPVSKWRQNHREPNTYVQLVEGQREGLRLPEEAASPEEDLLSWRVGCGGQAAAAAGQGDLVFSLEEHESSEENPAFGRVATERDEVQH